MQATYNFTLNVSIDDNGTVKGDIYEVNNPTGTPIGHVESLAMGPLLELAVAVMQDYAAQQFIHHDQRHHES